MESSCKTGAERAAGGFFFSSATRISVAAAACGGKKGWIQGVGLTIRFSQTRIYGTWSGCPLRGLWMISRTLRTVLKSKSLQEASLC